MRLLPERRGWSRALVERVAWTSLSLLVVGLLLLSLLIWVDSWEERQPGRAHPISAPAAEPPARAEPLRTGASPPAAAEIGAELEGSVLCFVVEPPAGGRVTARGPDVRLAGLAR
jgi:hypothetical protein